MPIENKIRSVVAKQTGDDVAFQRIEFSLLPRLRLVVRTAGISFLGAVTGTAVSIHIYPARKERKQKDNE